MYVSLPSSLCRFSSILFYIFSLFPFLYISVSPILFYIINAALLTAYILCYFAIHEETGNKDVMSIISTLTAYL